MHLSKLFGHFINSAAPTFKTISFIVDKSLILSQLAEAKESKDVEAVIESFAAPIGSWRDKKVAKFNLALDSYVGPGYIKSLSSNPKVTQSVIHKGKYPTISLEIVTLLIEDISLKRK